MDEDYIKECGRHIESFICRSFDNVKVTHVDSDEVTARTTIGFDAQEALERSEACEVYYRIQINNVYNDDVFEDRGNIIEHFRNVIHNEMEHNCPKAPDTQVIESDIPPSNVVHKPFVFYVRSVI